MSFLGLGSGKMDLQIDGTNFVSGDKINCTAILTLNQDVKAKGVVAELWAETMRTSYSSRGATRQKTVVYRMKSDLDGERTYSKSESPKTYKFTFVAPDSSSGAQVGTGMANQILGALENMSSAQGPIMWFIRAKVDLQLAFDISKTQQISINSASPPQGAMQ